MSGRYCFQLRVDPAHLDEYRRRHEAVWPEMLEALAAAGWRDYRLFLGSDGLLIGTFEADSLESALAAMEATEVDARWQAEMAELFVDGELRWLDQVFDLDEQRARLRGL